VKQRFCPYCRNFKADTGFKTVVEARSGSRRGMCQPCQEMRKKPHAELVALSMKEKAERTKK
jgi:hypothetical protein